MGGGREGAVEVDMVAIGGEGTKAMKRRCSWIGGIL
jgi:hypothetical protein